MIEIQRNSIFSSATNAIMLLLWLIFFLTLLTACVIPPAAPPAPPWYKSYGFDSYEDVIRPSSVSILIEALGDIDRWVSISAAVALGKIGPEAKEAVPALIKALDDPEAAVEHYAWDALQRMGVGVTLLFKP